MLGRRLVCALAALFAFAGTASAETVLKVALHSDLKIIDPIWTTALISTHHGNMVYDTLFAVDEKLEVQPQMVDKWDVSADKLTYTFTLRDGLEWHDGTAGHRRGLRRLDQALGGQGRHGPEADERGGVAHRARCQDHQDGAEGALRPGDRIARQVGCQRPLHDAQARRRHRSQHPDHRRHRLRPVHLQEGRVEARREGGLRQEPQVQAAQRAAPRAWPAARSPRSIASNGSPSPTSRPR